MNTLELMVGAYEGVDIERYKRERPRDAKEDFDCMRAALAAIPITEEMAEVGARTFFVAITPQYRLGEWQHQGFEDKVELHSAARAAITAFLAHLQKDAQT